MKKSNVIKLSIFLTLFSVFLISCKKNFDENLYNEINKKLESVDGNVIDLSKFITFDWDSAFVFRSYFSTEDMIKIIGLNLELPLDDGTRFLFVKNNKIVMYENIKVKWDQSNSTETYDLDNRIYFLLPREGYIKFNNKSAFFFAKKEISRQKENYISLMIQNYNFKY